MALSASERISLRRGIGDYGAAEEIYGVINGGSATALTARTSEALANAIGEHRLRANIEAALESGSTTINALGILACRQIMGGRHEGGSLVTELEAIT